MGFNSGFKRLTDAIYLFQTTCINTPHITVLECSRYILQAERKVDKSKEVVSPPNRTKIGTQFMSTLRRHRSLKYNTYGSHLFPTDRLKK